MLRGADRFDAVLNALSADSTSDFSASEARVTILRAMDGPFSSVRRVRIHTPARTSYAYIKILKPRRPGDDELARVGRLLIREYEATRAVYEALRDEADIGAVRPIACLPEYHALVTEEAQGRPLGDLLRQPGLDPTELARIASRAGRWVRIYQRALPSSGETDLAERRRYLDERLVLLEGRVLSADDRRGVLHRFDALAECIGPRRLAAVPIHADLTPTNIIVGPDGRVNVLDFTMAKLGPIHHDVSHLYFHFELLSSRHPGRQPWGRALQDALVRGYDPTLSAADPLFRLMLLQHSVCHVALLAERRVPILDRAYRWFLRRRWLVCEQVSERQSELHVA